MNINTTSEDLLNFYKQNLHTLHPEKFRPNDEDVTFTVRDNFIQLYERNILMAKNKLITIVKQYLAKNSSKYGARYPIERIPFMKSDMDIVFRACKVDPKELYNVTTAIDANNIDTDNHLIQNPFNIMCSIIAHVFFKNDKPLIAKVKNAENVMIPDPVKYQSPTYLIALYLTCYYYSKNYARYWKYDPDKNVMDYTIENMSNKYIIKKCTCLMDFNQYHSETNVENMWDRLLRGSDVDLIYFFSNLNNRISHALRTLATEYYKNKEEGNRSGNDSLTYVNGEGKTVMNDEMNSLSSDVVNTVRRITNSFFSETIISDKLVTVACGKTKYSKAKFLVILNRIRENRESDKYVYDIISSVLGYYLTHGGTVAKLKSNDFVLSSIKVYGISNTNDEFVLTLKKNLDTLVKLNSKDILSEGSNSAVERCRTSLFYYIVLYIAANSQ